MAAGHVPGDALHPVVPERQHLFKGDGGPDGGPKITPLTAEDGGQHGATICLGSGSDGGAQLSLVVTGKGVRASSLLDDGGFHCG